MNIPIAEPEWRFDVNSRRRAGAESASIYLTKFFDSRSGAEVYEVVEACTKSCPFHKGGLVRGHILVTGTPGTAGLRDILPKVLEMSPECEGVREVLGHILYLIGVTTKHINKDWLDD